jgi:phosphoribosylglycinamide formyltransferase 2
MATKMVQSLQGSGVFGMEFFIKGKEVYFNECSPRPHDTGYLTLKTQNLSEFDLHIRAIMGYPIGNIKLLSNGMSKAINYYNTLQYHVFNPAIVVDNWNDNYDLHFYYFNKPVVDPLKKRRVGLVISLADDLEESKKAIDNLLFS